jgi:hypothetical protein
MEHETGLALLKRLCKSKDVPENQIPALITELIDFGGIDTRELTVDMVLRGLNREPGANWDELRFSAYEMLSYFTAMGSDGMRAEFNDARMALVATIVIALAATSIPSGIGTGYELPNICLILHAMADVYYEELETVVSWVGAELRHALAPGM